MSRNRAPGKISSRPCARCWKEKLSFQASWRPLPDEGKAALPGVAGDELRKTSFRRTSRTTSAGEGFARLGAVSRVYADFRQIGKQTGGPPVDIVFADEVAHVLHTSCLLVARHGQSALYGAGKLLDVIRIYEQRIGELESRARERAEDQHTLTIFARGDEFLGHQIHAVVQRRHHAERSGAIEAGILLMRVVTFEEDNGLPVPGLEAGVDALGFAGNFDKQTLITLDIGAAGGSDLDEGEAALVGRVELAE